MIPPLEYLDWIRGRPGRAAFDLGSSDLGIGDDPLDRFADHDAPGSDLGAQLAAAYGVDPERVLVTAGATHANLLAAAAAREDGGRVLAEAPGYEPLVATPRALGLAVDRFERSPDADYALDPDRVADASRRETALVTVTDRHNPSGRRADRDALAATAAAAREAGARLLVDEVYAPYDRPGAADAGFADSAATIEGAVVTGSLTKFFGLGALRIGWLVADPPFVERARRAADHIGAVAPTSVALAERAFARRDALAADARERIATNADRLADFAAGRDDLRGTVHPGCTLAFLGHESADGDAVTSAAWDEGVLVVPGRFFDAPERVRISVAADPEAVAAGLDALGDALDSL